MSLYLIIGPMFSGKTTELLTRARKAAFCNENVVIVKYAGDTRYSKGPGDTNLYTHDQNQNFSQSLPCRKLSDHLETLMTYSKVYIDEGTLYEEDIFEPILKLLRAHKDVHVAALDANALQTPYSSICNLLPYAKKVKKLVSTCMVCKDSAEKNKASLTIMREDDSEISLVGQKTLIGSSDRYKAICFDCFCERKKLATPPVIFSEV